MTSTLNPKRPLDRSLRPPSGTPFARAADSEVGFSWASAEWFRDLELTEDRCRSLLEDLRWPEGVHCSRCDAHDVGRLEARKKYYCRGCRYQFSVTAGTIFHNSHLPLWKWFLTISLMLDSEAGIPANQLVQFLGGSYKTAWFVQHRVRAAIEEAQKASCCGSPDPSTCALESMAEQLDDPDRCARLFDRPIVGPYHQMGVKYVPAYLAELEWRSQSRGNPEAFRDTVLALLRSEPLAYSDLIRKRPANGRAAAGSARRSR